MGKNSNISWTHNTFNPWHGCTRVSPGCGGGTPGDKKGGCYAEAFSRRIGLKIWGQEAPRRFFGDKHWDEPKRWNERCAKAGIRERVFCASMADIFEDRADLIPHRERLWKLIASTPALDWLVLTKRPQNIARLGDDVLAQCWLGTTTEDQKRADERVVELLRVPARVHWVSAEPLLGPVDHGIHLGGVPLADGTRWRGTLPLLDWVVVGSESGPGARPMDLAWARAIVDRCVALGVPVFTKQISNAVDRKGENPEHWPPGNWPRQFPEARHG